MTANRSIAEPKKVLVLDPVDASGLDLIRAHPRLDLVHLPDPDEADIRREIVDAWALLLRGRSLDEAAWGAARRLALVSRHGVGCDNLPLDHLETAGVAVAIAADGNAISVAEHAMMLMLGVARRAHAYDAATRGGNFAFRESQEAHDLYGSVLLVVGLGRIGREVAARARAFGMDILGYDPALAPSAVPESVTLVPTLEQGLARADVVTLHLPRSDETMNLFDADRFAAMKPGAILVNVSRGGIVDETALIDALDRGTLAGAGIDVFAEEPVPTDHPILHRSDVLLSPHNAAMTRQGVRRMGIRAAQNIIDFLEGRLQPGMQVPLPHHN